VTFDLVEPDQVSAREELLDTVLRRRSAPLGA
jgi:hypothetical protein